MMDALTPAQQELYDWLVQYISQNQHAPSIRQMMRAMNLRSPNPVQGRLERLRDKGYVTWIEGKARTIKPPKVKKPGIVIKGAGNFDLFRERILVSCSQNYCRNTRSLGVTH